jgi:hypothetical protein
MHCITYLQVATILIYIIDGIICVVGGMLIENPEMLSCFNCVSKQKVTTMKKLQVFFTVVA